MPSAAQTDLAGALSHDVQSSAAPLPKPRPGRKPCPRKPVKILESAVKLFTSHDYHKVTIEEVAAAAGVGKGTVYRYFPTKEALFLELVDLAVSRAGEVIRAGAGAGDPAEVRLRRAVLMTFEYFRRNQPFLAILYHEKVFRSCREREELEHKRAALRSFFVRLLQEGIVEGSVRADVDPLLGAIVLMSSIRGFLRNFGTQRSSVELADQLLTMFFEGARKRAGASISSTAQAVDAQMMSLLDPLSGLSLSESESSAASPAGAAGED